MAGRRRRHGRNGYRTSAQRAALRKAQLASARKRRIKSNFKVAGYIAGGILASAAISGGTRAANHPIKTYRSAKKMHTKWATRNQPKPQRVARTVPKQKPRPIQYWGTKEHRRAAYAGQRSRGRLI